MLEDVFRMTCTFEMLVGEVEQEDKDDATVVSVDYSSASVNHKL